MNPEEALKLWVPCLLLKSLGDVRGDRQSCRKAGRMSMIFTGHPSPKSPTETIMGTYVIGTRVSLVL